MVKLSLMDQIKLDEGLRLKPYLCPAGKITIGYGRNLETKGISKSEANIMLLEDIAEAKGDARSVMQICGIGENKTVYNILTQMCYQLGYSGVMKFKKMLECLAKADYTGAAAEMLKSKWHKQTPGRCERLAGEMQNAAE